MKGLSARVEQKTRMNCPGCGALEGEKHRVHPCKGEVPEFWEYEQLWEDGKPVLDMRPDKEDPYIYLPYFIPFHWQHEAELPNVCPRCGLFNPRIYTVEDWGEVMPKVARGTVLCWECYRDFKEWRTGVRMDKPDTMGSSSSPSTERGSVGIGPKAHPTIRTPLKSPILGQI